MTREEIIYPSLTNLKIKPNLQLEWGKRYAQLLKDGKVIEFASKDQNMGLFMSSVSNGRDTVL